MELHHREDLFTVVIILLIAFNFVFLPPSFIFVLIFTHSLHVHPLHILLNTPYAVPAPLHVPIPLVLF